MDGDGRRSASCTTLDAMSFAARPPADLRNSPFIGSEAVGRGLITHEQLRATCFRRLFRDVYVFADIPDSLPLRTAAALLIAPPGAVLSGRTAAWIHGVDVRRPDEPVEINLPPGTPMWPRANLRVHRVRMPADDVTFVSGTPVTTPLRTGFDLARRKGLVSAVVAADACTHMGLFTPGELLTYGTDPAFKGWRGIRQVPKVVEHTEPKAESPGESRLRMIIVLGGFPRPEAQVNVYDRYGEHCGRLDLGYRELRLGVEYDGQQHREIWEQDVERQNRLLSGGWSVLRFNKADLSRGPAAVLPRIEASRSMLRGTRSVA